MIPGIRYGPQRWGDAEPDDAGPVVDRTPGEVAYLLHLEQQAAGPIGDLAPDRSQLRSGLAPLDQGHAEPFLERAKLLAERRLRDVARLRCAAEMPEIGDRHQISELS
jgi:hypothetical protein